MPVRYQVALDDRFRHVIRRGGTLATPELGHSVHPEIGGLWPDREYFYRFKVGNELSPVGRARTAPLHGPVRFATASCQSWQDGFYTAHRHLAHEDLAFVAFLGDYLYESTPSPAALRVHEGAGEPSTLQQYRNRHEAESPHWKYIDNRRGYFALEASRHALTAQLRTVSTVRAQEATVETSAAFVIRDGRPGVEQTA